MTPAPEISVVLSAFNAGNYLTECMKSILSQTYTNFEFIIVNDGSTDNSEEIITSFKDKRIIYIKNEINRGLIFSLNKGLSAAKGKYIARMDADDIALNIRLQKQLDFFQENNRSIVVGSDYYLLKKNKLTHIKNINNSDYQKAMLLFSPCFCHPTVMMKNIFSDNSLGYKSEYKHAEDYKLWTDLVFKGGFGNVDAPLLKYRSHTSQISANHKTEQLKISEKIREDYYKNIGLKFSDIELKALHIVGNNTFITSVATLNNIESAMINLTTQNRNLKFLNENALQNLLHKFWLDSCGNTSLGLKAFTIFTSSELFRTQKKSARQLIKLIGKCLIRKFRK